MNTPVLVRSSAVRSASVTLAACSRYAARAAAGVSCPPVHSSGVSSGQASGASASASGCSGASTMNVAPNRVSGRVVKTLNGCSDSVGKAMVAPIERPIQLRCMVLTDSGQSIRSRSSSRRSAYAVIRIFHWVRVRVKTGKFPRSLRRSAVTSSLARTVPRPGHQLTGASSR